MINFYTTVRLPRHPIHFSGIWFVENTSPEKVKTVVDNFVASGDATFGDITTAQQLQYEPGNHPNDTAITFPQGVKNSDVDYLLLVASELDPNGQFKTSGLYPKNDKFTG